MPSQEADERLITGADRRHLSKRAINIVNALAPAGHAPGRAPLAGV